MRTALLLTAIWLALFALAVAAARNAADLGAVVAERDASHARFAAIPFQEFTSDRANRLSGRVLSASGLPIADAEIRVYDWDACIEAAHAAAPGEWPRPQTERRARTDADGRYEMRELHYGAKLVVAAAAGRSCAVRSPISFADGYGAPETDFVLEERAPLRLRLLEADGLPAAGARLRLLPRAFGIEPGEAVADADGWMAIPPGLFAGSAPPRALWGEPPVPLEFASDVQELWLPARAALRIEVLGVREGPLNFTLLPSGARRAGAARFTRPAESPWLNLPAAPTGAWEVWVQQGERVGRAEFQSGGGTLQLALDEPQQLELSARSADGAQLAASFQWQSMPPLPAPLAEPDPFAWSAHFDPTARAAASEVAVAARLVVARGRGWIVAAAAGHALRTELIAAESESLDLILTPAREVAVRTDRPYLGVLAEPFGSPPLWGRADAAGEVFLLAAPGPLVARCELARGGHTLPRGAFVGGAADTTVRFSGVDEAGTPRGCVHGFVRDETGAPRSGVEVWIQGMDGRPVQETTDGQGWYRFVQLDAGLYFGFPRAADPEAMWKEDPVFVPLDANGAGVGRLDLILHSGIVDLDAAGIGLAAGEPVTLRAADGTALWTCTVTPERRIRVVSVPAGDYQLVRGETEATVLLGRIVVPVNGAPVTRFEEPR